MPLFITEPTYLYIQINLKSSASHKKKQHIEAETV